MRYEITAKVYGQHGHGTFRRMTMRYEITAKVYGQPGHGRYTRDQTQRVTADNEHEARKKWLGIAHYNGLFVRRFVSVETLTPK